jgi:hypothetical protein
MANEISKTDFPLKQNAYVAFDAQSLKNLIIDQLNRGGVFTDQIFEGSNFNSLLDVIAYSYHVLLFYLNQTSSESMFSQAQVYENMNRIVKLIDYNPLGYQTSVLAFNATADQQLSTGTYTIPRYSYFILNGMHYSFKEDITFTKALSGSVELEQLSNNNLLYQGSYTEYPVYFALGEPYEIVRLVLVDQDGRSPFVDNFTMDVYVKDAKTTQWSKWSQVPNLFLSNNQDMVYELRFNENGRYEIKFGNDITGKKLNSGDQILVYYLFSDGTPGEIGPGILDGNSLFLYSSTNYSTVVNDTKSENLEYMTESQLPLLSFTNDKPSTLFGEPETVDNIRNNAPNTFKRQYRLITTEDFKNYISATFKNIIHDLQVVDNQTYLSQHIEYLYVLGLKAPSLESRLLSNQVTFADACNFNNIYVYLVPRIYQSNSLKVNNNFTTDAQKQYIESFLDGIKLSTSEVVYMDPVYMAINFGISLPIENLTKEVYKETKLIIVKKTDSRINDDEIRGSIAKIFENYFDPNNSSLGQTLDLTELNNSVGSVNGVKNFYTRRITSDGRTLTSNGISILVWNSIYDKEDIFVTTQNYNLKYFQFPYLYDKENLLVRIEIIPETT